MGKPRVRVDFNEMVEQDLVLLSKEDSKPDSEGNVIKLFEGKQIYVYDEDSDDLGNLDNSLAAGVVEKTPIEAEVLMYGGVVGLMKMVYSMSLTVVPRASFDLVMYPQCYKGRIASEPSTG